MVYHDKFVVYRDFSTVFFSIPYSRVFGAVTSFHVPDFVKVGGFSTEFFGWGGEDDDMSRR